MAGGKFSLANLFGITLRESADDGSDFTNPDADYRRVFLGEDGSLHTKDSAGTVASMAGALSDHTHAVTGSGATGGGATLNAPTLNATGLFRLSGAITSTVNADQNDYAPTGIHLNGSIIFTSFSANRTVTGISAGVAGEVLILQNNTNFSLLLTNESVSSTGANRFRSPNAATHTVRQGGSALLCYLNNRWCVIAA